MTCRARPRLRVALLLAVASASMMGAVSGCSADDDPGAQMQAAEPASRAVVPSGWEVQQAPGFRIATPPDWAPRPDDLRLAPDAALEVGVPYTGQDVALPLMLGFVERERVGPLDVREQLLRLQLEQALPDGATLGASTHVEVAGAVDAIVFDAVYATPGGESVTGAPVAATTVRQRELLVETPGLPKYGLRFTAPADDFPEQLWMSVLNSLVVSPGASPPPSSTGG